MTAGTRGPVAVAVSGGSDSHALLLLADLWSRQTARALVILTVDHGLRAASAGEARAVVERASALGHDAQRLTWNPDKRSQQAARSARHRLIAAGARQAGAGVVLFGHTRTDFEETLLMRLARPTTLAGAAGPQPVSVSPAWPEGRGLLVARPLINVRRDVLKSWLSAQGETWVNDPGNESEAYERVRVRQLIAELNGGRLSRIAADAMRLRALEDAQLAASIDRYASADPSGLIVLSGMPQAVRGRERFLSLVLQVAAGAARPAQASALSGLAEDIASGGPGKRMTLGGAWIQRKGEAILIGRDPGEFRAGWSNEVWDGRYVSSPGAASVETLPFLVRHAVPQGGGWQEILSERLANWSDALRRGSGIGTALYAPDSMQAATIYPG